MTRFCVLLALGWPCAGLAQALPVPAVPTEQQYLDLIAQEQEAGGPSAHALIEPMTALGQLYLEQRDYDRAAETFARARGVMRAADGFDTLAEVPLILYQAEAEEGGGDLEAAWNLETSALVLAQQHAGEPGTFPIFQAATARRRALLADYSGGARPRQIQIGCYYGQDALLSRLFPNQVFPKSAEAPVDDCNSGNYNTVLTALNAEIRNYQLLALEALIENGRYASDEMQELVSDVLVSIDRIRRTRRSYATYGAPYRDWAPGNVLIQLVSYQPRNRAETIRRGYMLVLLADENVLRAKQTRRYREQYDSVLGQYQRAYEVLRSAGVEQEALDAMFAPAIPIALPTYTTTRLARAGTTESDAYVDVSFTLTTRGTTDEVEVTGTSEDLRRLDRWKIIDLVKNGVFRPRFVEGQVVDAAGVAVRYHAGD